MKWLTKSDYLKYLVHPDYLWLAKHDKDKLPQHSENDQARFAAGDEVESYARQLFPETILIEPPNFFDGPDVTAAAMKQPAITSLFQASVLTDNKLYAAADVIVRTPDGWDLYEIKSGTKVADSHLHDLAFQYLVFAKAGHKVSRCFVMHINPHYTRHGDIEPSQLFMTEEVTDKVLPLLKQTAKNIVEARKVIDSPNCPKYDFDLCGNLYAWRDIYRHLHPDLPSSTLLNLTRLKLEQLLELQGLGITAIAEIPQDFNLGPEQLSQVEVTRSGAARLHPDKITHELAKLEYPLYFLDYETFSSAIPMWDGVRPYQQLPFQYSLHAIPFQGAKLTHYEHLAQGTEYPAEKLLDHLTKDLGPEGSVIVWNKSFEMGCNDAMAALHPKYKDFLEGVNARVYDLMEIFANGYYAHPEFMGSASIKKVLPVLVPELSYKDLAIGEGMTAQVQWMKAARGIMSEEEAERLYAHLITYCGQDTLAMVRIFEVLQAVTSETAPAAQA
ncbi:MAG TPA: DUF2779 domain-containing protein [Candidatus Saccharimonadia bacterium]|jgi:hypothetical protein